jgi:myo-inositol-1(or 4)-monophosphatase
MQPTLDDLKDIASRAGDLLRSGYGKRHQIHHKGVIDLVTEVDHQSEDLIVQAIRQRFPSHRIITEESGTLVGDGDLCWHIDPLDGTVNYAHDIPIFAVSIAFAVNSQIQLGVVYDPLRDECFSAEKGQGARLNGQPIHVSAAPDLEHSLMVTGFPYDMWKTPHNNLDYFSYFSLHTQGVRRLGSAALDLAYVACGRMDGFWELTIKTWDIAAGALLVQEAGGIASRPDGSPDFMVPPCNILASNPLIHPILVDVFRKFEKQVK